MHDIWNPWHGCHRVSPGCENCYMYFLDEKRGQRGSRIYRTKNFDYPLQRTHTGQYRVQSGELIRVCMTSDFFLPEADPWREAVWDTSGGTWLFFSSPSGRSGFGIIYRQTGVMDGTMCGSM